AAWLSVGTTALLIALMEDLTGDRARGALLALAAAAVVGFIRADRAAADPVLPLDLFLRPAIAAAIGGNIIVGILLFGIDTYVPLYVQGAQGGQATDAGYMITPLFLSWSISVAVAAALVVRLGYRTTGLFGSALVASGTLALALGAEYPAWATPAFLGG